MNVLVVEDELKTAEFIRKGMRENGFHVDIAHHGGDAFKLATTHEYDIIILDIMIPGIDGREVLHRLRAKNNLTPVIFLTALDGLEDRLEGLKLGADDYLVKPFAFSELMARVQSVLRRTQAKDQTNIYQIADLELDLTTHRIVRQGIRINLTPKEFTLLSLLLRFKGDVLTRTRIAERIWNLDNFHDTNVVDVHMRRLRAKVDDPFVKKLIHTVRGVGYVLEDRDENSENAAD
jgi:two-component system, OmpR family, copper resistance phosphate regulon response regulator CusR